MASVIFFSSAPISRSSYISEAEYTSVFDPFRAIVKDEKFNKNNLSAIRPGLRTLHILFSTPIFFVCSDANKVVDQAQHQTEQNRPPEIFHPESRNKPIDNKGHNFNLIKTL